MKIVIGVMQLFMTLLFAVALCNDTHTGKELAPIIAFTCYMGATGTALFIGGLYED